MDFHWCCELIQGVSAVFVLAENDAFSWSFHSFISFGCQIDRVRQRKEEDAGNVLQ